MLKKHSFLALLMLEFPLLVLPLQTDMAFFVCIKACNICINHTPENKGLVPHSSA